MSDFDIASPPHGYSSVTPCMQPAAALDMKAEETQTKPSISVKDSNQSYSPKDSRIADSQHAEAPAPARFLLDCLSFSTASASETLAPFEELYVRNCSPIRIGTPELSASDLLITTTETCSSSRPASTDGLLSPFHQHNKGSDSSFGEADDPDTTNTSNSRTFALRPSSDVCIPRRSVSLGNPTLPLSPTMPHARRSSSFYLGNSDKLVSRDFSGLKFDQAPFANSFIDRKGQGVATENSSESSASQSTGTSGSLVDGSENKYTCSRQDATPKSPSPSGLPMCEEKTALGFLTGDDDVIGCDSRVVFKSHALSQDDATWASDNIGYNDTRLVLENAHTGASVAEPADSGQLAKCVSNEDGRMVGLPSSVASQPLMEKDPTTPSSSPKKRPRDAENVADAPAPKRMTLLSQKQQHRKLASPFRSPLLAKPNPSNVKSGDEISNYPVHSLPRSSSPLANSSLSTDRSRSLHSQFLSATPSKLTSANNGLKSSTKATSQFKSPLAASASQPRPGSTRAIHELERKIQVLKRAIKIKSEDDEEKLEQLAKKWKQAGRDAAWELWDIVRNNEESAEYPFNSESRKAPKSISESWGWEESDSKLDGNWGWADDADTSGKDSRDDEALCTSSEGANEVDGDQKDVQTKTLGTMLHQLGIAHGTLGWVESEEDFTDN